MMTKKTTGCAILALLAGSATLLPATFVSAATEMDRLSVPAMADEVPGSFQVAQLSLGDAVDAATDEVNKAADAAVSEATKAAGAAEEETTEAAESAEAEMTEDEATEAAESETAEEAEAEEGTEEAEATEAEAGEETETAETEASDTDALTTDGFDMSTASSLIDASSISEVEKMALKTSLEQAQSNPELLDATLQQVRGALGM